jgi:hypothetical protein
MATEDHPLTPIALYVHKSFVAGIELSVDGGMGAVEFAGTNRNVG